MPPPSKEPESYHHQYNLQSRKQLVGKVVNAKTVNLEEYSKLIKGLERQIWEQAYANDLGRLAQGVDNIKGTNTIFFIAHYEVPKGKSLHTEKRK